MCRTFLTVLFLWTGGGAQVLNHTFICLYYKKKQQQNNVPINLSFNKGLHRKETVGQREPKREEEQVK